MDIVKKCIKKTEGKKWKSLTSTWSGRRNWLRPSTRDFGFTACLWTVAASVTDIRPTSSWRRVAARTAITRSWLRLSTTVWDATSRSRAAWIRNGMEECPFPRLSLTAEVLTSSRHWYTAHRLSWAMSVFFIFYLELYYLRWYNDFTF